MNKVLLILFPGRPNITRQLRSQLIGVFTDYGARVRILYLKVPWSQWKQQNARREYAVPEAVVCGWPQDWKFLNLMKRIVWSIE